jgi:hypothetical protein
MVYQQVLAVQDRSGASAPDTGWRPMPGGLTAANARIDLAADTDPNAFTDPTEGIELEVWWRNAAAYGDYSAGAARFVGRAGRTRAPAMGQGVPAPYPTDFRATLRLVRLADGAWVPAGAETVIRFGVSVEAA